VEEYELRPVDERLELTGGMLKETLRFPAEDRDAAVRVVGSLSQRAGSVLRIFDTDGNEVETQRRDATVVLPGAVGGLTGRQSDPRHRGC
jgi:hypothetical protein